MDLSGLNDVAHDLRIDEFKGPFPFWSGMLVFSPSFIPNWRLSGYGGGGYKITDGTILLGGTPYTRSLSFTVGRGGLGLEKTIRLAPALTLLPGATLGLGTYAFGLAQTREQGNDFPEIVSDSALIGALNSYNRYGRFVVGHFFAQATVSLEYVTGPVMFRGGVGYNLSATFGDWFDDAGADIRNFPNVKADGPMLYLGIFAGLFSQ
jgi:hypothetical protein